MDDGFTGAIVFFVITCVVAAIWLWVKDHTDDDGGW